VSGKSRKSAISIYDIARELGVSSGTVSRAFNDHPEVSKATRERILAKAKELGYTPSPLARALARNETSAIGIVIPTIYDPFFLDFAQGVQEAATAAGIAVMMSFTDTRPDALVDAVRSFVQLRVAGIVLLGGSGRNDSKLAAILGGTPAMVALRRTRAKGLPSVFVDHQKGAEQMMALLASKGRHHIGFASLPLITQASVERLEGYRRAHQALGLPNRPVEAVAPGNSFSDGVTVTDTLLALPGAVGLDAIFYASDALATGGLHALALAGRSVPDEIAVAGFGDIISSAVTQPALTTVHVPMREIGEQSIRLLLDIIAGAPDAPRQVELASQIVQRASV
jgi:DNA-binding LacI/PurR family transcriptional regulator